MNPASNILLAGPEVILAVSALGLLVWGAFDRKVSAAFIGASMLALVAAAVAAVIGPHGRAFDGGLIADSAAISTEAARISNSTSPIAAPRRLR